MEERKHKSGDEEPHDTPPAIGADQYSNLVREAGRNMLEEAEEHSDLPRHQQIDREKLKALHRLERLVKRVERD